MSDVSTLLGSPVPRSLHQRAAELLRKVVVLSRHVEEEFGKDDDRTIVAKNANCSLYELEKLLAHGQTEND